MGTATILQLPQTVGLTGGEPLETVQGTTSVRTTVAQIAALSRSLPTGVAAAIPSAGANNDYTASGLMGPSIGFIDLTPTADCNITGLQAGFDGQIVIVTNLSAFNVTLNALNSGSQSVNQFRMVGDFVLPQNNGKTFKYSVSIGKWVAM